MSSAASCAEGGVPHPGAREPGYCRHLLRGRLGRVPEPAAAATADGAREEVRARVACLALSHSGRLARVRFVRAGVHACMRAC
eukprot:10493517-Alexandrium_andersonii.AAC.1